MKEGGAMTQEKTINEISVKVGRLELMQENSIEAVKEMATSVSSLVVELKESNNIAREALEKSKSAHKRLDAIAEAEKARKSKIEWFWKLILTPIILGALALMWKVIIDYSK